MLSRHSIQDIKTTNVEGMVITNEMEKEKKKDIYKALPRHTMAVVTRVCTQSNVIFICSSGIGTKLSSEIFRDASSGSQCGGTSRRIRSGRTDNSVWIR